MQEIQEKTARETELLQTLASLEDLGEKKTKIYSRLLTDVALAKGMEARANASDERRARMEKLLHGDTPKKANAGGMSAVNGERSEE